MTTNSMLQLAAVTFWLFFANSTFAEQRDIDEIIVSADFRERPAQTLAASISVLDAELIDDAAVQHFEELVNLVPNLNWSGDGHRARYFQIRGVGELEQYQGAPNPSVGFLIDDIDFSGIATVATLFDVQSIEVMRGSQGSRYGANALGGLIYMQSTAPSAERDGRVELTVGGDDAFSVGAAFGGAMNATGTTTFRLSAQKHESNGFRDNTHLNRKDTNGRDELGVRGRLRFEPAEDIVANLSLLYSNIDDGYDAFALDNSYTVLSDKPGRDAQESIGASLRLDWSGHDDLTLTSITASADSDIEFSFDADWGNDESWNPFTYDFVTQSERRRQTISQEFRLASEDWLVGIFALNLKDELQTMNVGEYIDPFSPFSDSLNDQFESDYKANNIAVFGQIDRDLSDVTHLAFGLRAEHRGTDYMDTGGLDTGPSDFMWGGEISLRRDHNERVMSYISLSKGYKAGGFNLGLVRAERREFRDESLWTVELGLKSALLENKLRLNASIFHSRRDDQQIRTSFQLVRGDPASFGFATINVEKGKTTGLEADVRWFLSDNWEIYANLGLLTAKIDEVGDSVSLLDQSLVNLNGRDQAHAPQYTLATGFVYRHPKGYFARVDVTAKDEFFFDVSHGQKSTRVALANARLGIEGESWLISLWARNLFDRKYSVRGFFFGNEPPDFPATLYTRLGDARQLGVTVEKRF